MTKRLTGEGGWLQGVTPRALKITAASVLGSLGLLTLFIVWIYGGFSGCDIGSGPEPDRHERERRECRERGERYHREMESWPLFSDGRVAADVVRERCDRSYTNYDFMH